jgi:hypothetical protein
LLGIDFVNCGYNFGVLGDAESSNESIRKKGERENAYSVMKNNLNKSLREKEVEKKRKIYIKVQIDRAAASTLAASTSYAGLQNGLSKAIVSIRKPIRTFSTGGQFVAGRYLYSNK